MIEFILGAPFVLSAAIVIAISIAVLLEYEKNGWATSLFSIGIALVLWSYKTVIFDFVSASPMATVYFALSYIIAGLVWSLIKWKNYIGKNADKFYATKEEFERTHVISKDWELWITHLKNNFSGCGFFTGDSAETTISKIIPKALAKKALIVSWISYWPMSLSATLLNNPFRRFFEWVYGLVSGIYDKIGNHEASKMLSGVTKDVMSSVEPKKIIKG